MVNTCVWQHSGGLTDGSNGPSKKELASKGCAVPAHVLEALLAEVDRTSQTSSNSSQDVPVLQTDVVLVLRQESLTVVHITGGRCQLTTGGEEFWSEGY